MATKTAKKPAKKTAAKKTTTTKKTAVKKTTAKKAAPAKKATAKKATTKKTTAKKSTVAKKTTTAKKTTAKKTTAKKATAKKTAVKKTTTAKKAAPKKTTTAKKAAAKKTTTTKKAAAKKTTTKKTTAAKKTTKKVVAKKTTAKKTAAPKKTATKKAEPKKAATKAKKTTKKTTKKEAKEEVKEVKKEEKATKKTAKTTKKTASKSTSKSKARKNAVEPEIDEAAENTKAELGEDEDLDELEKGDGKGQIEDALGPDAKFDEEVVIDEPVKKLSDDEKIKRELTDEIASLSEDFEVHDILSSFKMLDFFRGEAGECMEKGCENPETTMGYCRYHYIKNWQDIKKKQAILSEGKLQQMVEGLFERFPRKNIEAIIHDLADDKTFFKVLQELNIETSNDQFEDSADENFEEEDYEYAHEAKYGASSARDFDDNDN